MYTPAGRNGATLLVVILLLISILLEQWIARLCPWLSEMGGIRPMIVFLDIPLRAPVVIDWLPVGFIFIFFYTIATSPRGETRAKEERRKKSWAVLGRWWLLLVSLLTSGALYSWLSDYLPKQVRNGIDSFGVRADLILPYPSEETIHLQGSMIMLVFFIIGWRLLVRKAAVIAPAALAPVQIAQTALTPVEIIPAGHAPAAAPPARATLPERGKITMRIPEPVEVKNTGARPCAPVAMPETPSRRNAIQPCVVEGEIKPVIFRKKELQQ
jgi:hypothetical protein